MSSVDQRVVEMKFNSTAFAKGIAETLASLTRLQDGLKLNGASQGAVDAASGLDQLGQKTGFLGGQFSAMQAVALGALASIGAKAVQIGQQVVSSLSIAPVMQGFQEYETNMNSIQTILANTSAAGTGLPEVNAALDEMNLYSDKTIYNFSEMAKNVGTFTAAGVNLDTATGSIKGIANLAALSGSNSQQAAGAMYQLSQEIAAGKVTLMGWNSVVNAGMGGSVFQRALAETAVAMGKIDKSSLTLEGDMKNVKIAGESFRDSISAEGGGESWLTSDVLTNTLQQFTGDLNEAELAAQGFTAEQIKAIQSQAKMAVGAATEVKTLSGLMDTLKEGVASGWSQTFRILVGDFEEAKTLFTGISNSVGGFLGGMAQSRNDLLTGWKDLGGRTVLIEGLTEAFWALGSPLAAVGQAFRQIFPKTTAQDLFNFTEAFRDFMLDLQPSAETMDRLRRTFAGLFAILGIGWEIIKAVAKFLLDMFRGVEEGDKGILKITATIGDWLVALHAAVKNGEGLTKFFDGLKKILFLIINPIKDAASALGDFFADKGDAGAIAEGLAPIGEAGSRIGAIFSGLGKVLGKVWTSIKGVIANIGEALGNIGKVFEGNGWEFNADTIMKALGAGLGAGFLVVLNNLRKAISNFDLFGGSGGGFLDSIKETLGGVNDTLGAMQANLKANALIKIAAAIAILALAVFVLAGIDSAGLLRATAALTAMFIQLGVAMAAFSKIGSATQAVKLTIMGFALMFFAIAILILTAAVKKLSELDWGELSKGLVGVTALIAGLAGAAKLMSGQSGAMLRTGAMLMLLAIAVRILVESVEALAALGWGELAKGLVGVGVLLGALALFTKFADADKGGLSQGLGILLLAVALKVLASAVGDFAKYNWEELSQGMVGIGVGLALIAGALKLIPEKSALAKGAAIAIVAWSLGMIADAVGKMSQMSWEETAKGLLVMAGALLAISFAIKMLPQGAIFSAAAIFVVAASLGMIADALADMGQMSWGELVKGLVGLAGALLIISLGLKFMENSLPGAAALIVAAAALRILFPVIQGFASMSWGDLIKGLIGLAGVFLILGVAGLVLAPVALVLLAVGGAILMLGAGVILAAVGVMLFATALTVLAAAGAAGAAAFGAIVMTFVNLIPAIMAALAAGIVAFALVIAAGAPALIGAFVAVLTALLQAIIDITPKIAETMLTLLAALLLVITNAVPMMVEAGTTILIAFLRGIADRIGDVAEAAIDIIVNLINGIANNIGKIIEAGTNLVTKFLDGMATAIPKVVDAGFQMIIDIANGIAESIRTRTPELMNAGLNIVDAIIDGIADGVTQLAGRAVQAVKDLAGNMLQGAKDFLGINSPSKVFRETVGMAIPEGIAVGIDKYSHLAENSTLAMGGSLLDTMGKTISGLGDMVGGMDEFNPVITPVLDLSAVQRGSAQIGDILSAAPIDLRDAMANAGDASAGYAANLEALVEAVAANSGVTQNFTQNNYSPKPLSQAEIYRQTNNQISQAKGALTNAN